MEISRLDLSSQEWEVSRFRTGQVNNASSSLNLAAKSNNILPTRTNDDAPEYIPQWQSDPFVNARAIISSRSLEEILQEVQNPDSVQTPVQISQVQPKSTPVVCVNDNNSAHAVPSNGSVHSNAAAWQQGQQSPDKVFNQASSNFGADDMILTMPYSSHQTSQNSFVFAPLKYNDSELLITSPTTQKTSVSAWCSSAEQWVAITIILC